LKLFIALLKVLTKSIHCVEEVQNKGINHIGFNG